MGRFEHLHGKRSRRSLCRTTQATSHSQESCSNGNDYQEVGTDNATNFPSKVCSVSYCRSREWRTVFRRRSWTVVDMGLPDVVRKSRNRNAQPKSGEQEGQRYNRRRGHGIRGEQHHLTQAAPRVSCTGR